jgi:hypothetical protein
MGRKDWTSEKIFSRLVHNKSDKTYWDNIGELRKRPKEDVFQIAYRLAEYKIDKEKCIGIDVLVQLGFEPRFRQQDTINLLFKLLDKPQSEDVLFKIFFGIYWNNNNLTKEQILKLIEFKNIISKDVRYSLTMALLGIKNQKAIDTLIELSQDKFSKIRNWATFGIGTISEKNSEKIVNALWKRTNDKHQETKLEAIVGLAKRNQIKVKQQIIRELENGEYGILLFEAIEILDDKSFIPYLEKNLKSSKNDRSIR